MLFLQTMVRDLNYQLNQVNTEYSQLKNDFQAEQELCYKHEIAVNEKNAEIKLLSK